MTAQSPEPHRRRPRIVLFTITGMSPLKEPPALWERALVEPLLAELLAPKTDAEKTDAPAR